ncbi:YaaA family protein [Pseudoclavibacter sp. 13-3]|uniref:YaaA family protein n=1 Tax=Pseudoclavibacter sp. 13-3 TaxID=2901228 RepID=UPI001E4309EC|nr:peroxide stress protein YaaA [Pseudoclavibacter sp. 13-3]MCD7101015.1 peroxide stress protein YaaA [Pseudoclavibacter sp. 13-3]
MLLLPPSETKSAGGDRPSLDMTRLSFASTLTAARRQTIHWLTQLCADPDSAAQALRLTVRQARALQDDRHLDTAATTPAVQRYTGVLYDAIGEQTLAPPMRSWLGAHVFVQSALFGLISLSDEIPTYRLSAGTRKSVYDLNAAWHEPCTAVLQRRLAEGATVIDLRSKSYAALAPLPEHPHAHVVEVVVRDEDGRHRPLNHFNKKSKGAFTRALAECADERAADAMVVDNDRSLLAAAADRIGARLICDGEGADWLLEIVKR